LRTEIDELKAAGAVKWQSARTDFDPTLGEIR